MKHEEAREQSQGAKALWMEQAIELAIKWADARSSDSPTSEVIAAFEAMRLHLLASPPVQAREQAKALSDVEAWEQSTPDSIDRALAFGARTAETLLSIGRAIGFGRAQQILGEQWDAEHNCAPRGSMGVTVPLDAATPPAEQAKHSQCPHCEDGVARERFVCSSCGGAFVTREQMRRNATTEQAKPSAGAAREALVIRIKTHLRLAGAAGQASLTAALADVEALASLATPSQPAPEDRKASVPSVTKWVLTTDPVIVRRMGKTGEECAELLAVTTRIAIQGIDENDPGSGKTNRQRLIEEIGDVYAQLDANVQMLGLDDTFIQARRVRKLGYMREWESLYASPTPAQGAAPGEVKL